MWTIGLSTGCFFSTPIEEILDPIRDAGFRTIEVCSAPEHLDYHDEEHMRTVAARMRRMNLAPHSLHAPFAEHVDISAQDEALREGSRRELLQVGRSAGLLGVRYLVAHPGPERGGFSEEEHLQRRTNVARVLDDLVRECRRWNLQVALENMLPHLFAGHMRDLLWILGAVRELPVGFCLDTGHAHLAGELTTAVEKLSGHLWMLHAADNRGEADSHMPPGEGNIDWSHLIQRLLAGGFSGTLILEIAGEKSIDRTLEKACQGRAHLEQMMRRAREHAPADSTTHAREPT
jgi:sugar phosphate isomerase/epimerase